VNDPFNVKAFDPGQKWIAGHPDSKPSRTWEWQIENLWKKIR